MDCIDREQYRDGCKLFGCSNETSGFMKCGELQITSDM
jgi:hypothetical protein